MAVRGSGNGKLILFGEHAAVYGHRAIGIPLDLATIVEIADSGERVSFSGASEQDAARLEPVLRALGVVGGRVSVRSTVPRGLGFGSSAALCVALAAALRGTSLRGVWEAAHRAESFFHGTPSGIDTGLALLPGLRVFLPRPPELPQDARLPDVELSLVVGSVPRSRSTAGLVAELRERIASGERGAGESIAELGRLAAEAEAVIRVESGGALCRRLAALADAAQRQLELLRLSTSELDAALRRGKECGALGGKLSGAGGGGAFFLLAPDLEGARRIAAQLSSGAALPSIRAVSFVDGVARGVPD